MEKPWLHLFERVTVSRNIIQWNIL